MLNLKNIFKNVEYVIVGLGNPGPKYENTRHNAGFLTIDYIISKLNLSKSKIKHHSEIFDTIFSNRKILLVKPLTYMNLSGNAVNEILNYYKLSTKNLIVISDDISLDVGKLRIRKKGSSGGHNGLKSIILQTGNSDFSRIKIGIGHKPENWDLADWVISKFSAPEREKLNIAICTAYSALQLIIDGQTDVAMNKFNS